ncbi:MAG: arginine decarboxylase, pyruvoyl-dependent [Peptococcaceae bacterium]|nr:arginine decarboxylase, pyruvoyl-dependent [Peptococcaceae bacterium]
MLPRPTKYFLTAASAEGKTELTAFDNSLLAAGVGNLNLLRVSSILPPRCELDAGVVIPEGSLLPIAYGSLVSSESGSLIAAAVAVGIPADGDRPGVIMEHSGVMSAAEAKAYVIQMVEEAFEKRGVVLADVKTAAVEHCVESVACVFAAVPLWY